MSIFDLPKVSQSDIVADIKRRMANSQTVTEDDLRRLTGSDEPQVIAPLGMFTKLLEKLATLREENEAQLLRHEVERNQLKARASELEQSNNILHRRVAKLVEIIQECDCDDDI